MFPGGRFCGHFNEVWCNHGCRRQLGEEKQCQFLRAVGAKPDKLVDWVTMEVGRFTQTPLPTDLHVGQLGDVVRVFAVREEQVFLADNMEVAQRGYSVQQLLHLCHGSACHADVDEE